MDVQAVVLETLGRAVSQDLAVLKEAEAKLQEWETQPGFYSLLKDIFCNQSIDISLRLMAILLCKNGVERYWRPNAPNAISENEKAVIRESFISNFHIPEKQLAAHLSVVVSRIARHDWPGQWSSLMPTLMSGVDSEDQLSQRVALLTLHQVVKGLSSRRLLPDRRLFQEFTSSVFPFIRQVWDTHTEVFFTKLAPEQAQNEEDFKSLELSLLSLKILDKLVIHGFKEPHKSNEVQLFLPSLFLRLKNMATFRPLLKCATCETLASKYIVKGTNLLLGLLEHHPFSFVDQISTALEFAVFFAFSPPAQPCLFERFLIQCFNLIKSILLCQEYKPSKLPDDNKDPQAVRAHQLKESFFTETMLAEICHRLITRYFLLTPRDLELWDSDPEAFATDEVGESWKYALRPSSETLFATLFHEYRVQLTPVIVELVREHQPPVSPFDMSAILLKDAVYNAVGIGSFDLYDVINLDEWYKTSLKSEMSVLETNYRIIRRRVAWLLGAWTGMSSELYPSVYRDMIGLLRPEEDLVVRLSAANTIRSVLDDFEFNLDSFLEFLEPIFLSLFDLLKQANESDTKMKVLNVLYFIIERVGLSMEPYYQRLVGYLPLLWQESQGHSMLRCAVVATLVHLVRAIGKINESEEVANFILSVISVSTDTAEDSHIYLLEEGLELWYCVLGHTPPNSASLPPLIQLFRNIPPLLENNSEHLKLCCSVITAYVMLAPHEILQIYGETLIRLFADLLTDMRSEGIVHIMRLLEIFLKVNATLSCSLLKPLLPNIFENIYKDEELPAMMGLYLSILSRVLLTSQQVFIETVTKVSEGVWKSPDEVLSKIMDVWLKKMPLISQSEKKKLLALALSSLVIANFRFVYDKFQGIVLAVTEVLNDITRIDETGALIDCLVYSSGEQDEKGSCNTEHELRKWELALRDPVHTTVLADYFTTQILNLKRDVGPNDFEKFLSTLDESTLTMAREYVPL